MTPYDLILTAGPFGDQTSCYAVRIKKDGLTVGEICYYAVNESGEWGYISVNSHTLEYRCGKVIFDTIPPETKGIPISSCTAGGGWSRMDYRIKI